ncbi:MAG: hydroxyacid dehydrogenase [Burkholderiales bacterium]|nr:hydroxyacid dehydrogenase [Burkholderiales bacterium]
MADVVIPEFMDQEAAGLLQAEYDVHWDRDLWRRRPELFEHVADARAIVVRNQTRVDAELLAAAPRLRVVARMGVGLDNFDLAACKARGVDVRPSIGANALSVAEYVIATAMILLRRQALCSTAALVAGNWPRERLANGVELAGRTMGIVGFGSIGQVAGAKARAMGMDLIAYDSMLPADAPAWSNARRVSFDALIAEADVISLHCPLLPETRNLIGAPQFARMKPGAVLINSARGGIVNEADCAAALREGRIAGAALDSFSSEPITKEIGALFQGLDNVILTPHVAGVTVEANQRIGMAAVDTIRRVLGVGRGSPRAV